MRSMCLLNIRAPGSTHRWLLFLKPELHFHNYLLTGRVQTRNQPGHKEKRAIKRELQKEEMCMQQNNVT